jgi:hypothetical protein
LARRQLGEELGAGLGHPLDGPLDRHRGAGRRVLHAADLADVLTRRRLDLLDGGRGLEPAQGGDVAAHADRLGPVRPLRTVEIFVARNPL